MYDNGKKIFKGYDFNWIGRSFGKNTHFISLVSQK